MRKEKTTYVNVGAQTAAIHIIATLPWTMSKSGLAVMNDFPRLDLEFRLPLS